MVESVCLQGRATGRLYILLYYTTHHPKKKDSPFFCLIQLISVLFSPDPMIVAPPVFPLFIHSKTYVGVAPLWTFQQEQMQRGLLLLELSNLQSACAIQRWVPWSAEYLGIAEMRHRPGLFFLGGDLGVEWKVEKWLNYVREEQKQATIGDHLKLVIDLLHVFLIPSDVSTNLCENKTLVWTPNHLNSGTPENSLAYSRYIRIRNSW